MASFELYSHLDENNENCSTDCVPCLTFLYLEVRSFFQGLIPWFVHNEQTTWLLLVFPCNHWLPVPTVVRTRTTRTSYSSERCNGQTSGKEGIEEPPQSLRIVSSASQGREWLLAAVYITL